MKLTAVDLINYTEDQIWQIEQKEHIVIFVDGEIMVPWQCIVICHYYWRLFREFPGCVIQKKHIFLEFNAKTHQVFGARVFWDVYNSALNKYPMIIWDMNKVFYEIGNSLYNAHCTRLSEYVTTASLHDIIEILKHEEIVKAKQEYKKTVTEIAYSEKPTEQAIAKVHRTVKNVLYGDDGYLPNNNIKKMCVADIVSPGQMIQLIGPRGFVHDIDGKVFRRPIDVGYAEGMTKLYDSAIESRSAARALFMHTDPLQQSEYFNREMQLLCSVIHSVEGESCTGFHTIPFMVTDGDLELLKGKYHMVDGQPILIWDSIEELIGKVIQLRSITACGNHNTQTVCKNCLGWSANVIPPGTNVGYAIVTILCAIISQLMLSTKHYEASVGSQLIEINERMSKWIRMCRVDSTRLMLQKNMVKKNPIIRLDIDSVRQLNNIQSVDVSELTASRITNCKSIQIVEGDLSGNQLGPFEELKTVVAGQGVFLTTEVLQYLKSNGWVSNTKYIEFQLKNWDPEVPIFGTPRLGDNIHLFLKEVKSFIMPTKESEISITDYLSRGAALGEFITLLRKRLKFNIIQVEIFIRACMTVDGLNNDYLLPRPDQSFKFMSAKHCLYNRSLTTLLAYETQAAAICDTMWYKKVERVTHMMDDILTTY